MTDSHDATRLWGMEKVTRRMKPRNLFFFLSFQYLKNIDFYQDLGPGNDSPILMNGSFILSPCEIILLFASPEILGYRHAFECYKISSKCVTRHIGNILLIGLQEST
jgi:hypothetical protein